MGRSELSPIPLGGREKETTDPENLQVRLPKVSLVLGKCVTLLRLVLYVSTYSIRTLKSGIR